MNFNNPDFYKYILDKTQIGIYEFTLEGKILSCNRWFLEIFEYDSLEQLQNEVSNIRDLYKNPNRRDRILSKLLREKDIHYIATVITRSGDKRVLRFNLTEYEIDNKYCYFGFFEDISKVYYGRKDIRRNFRGTISALSKMIELRDSYTYQHQHNVLSLVTKICNVLDMNGNERRCIKWAAELHDIGKIYIPAEILTKSTTLTTIEKYLIQSHPELGHQIVCTIPFHCTPKVADIVLQHHERLDGSGYPNHLTEHQISLGAKIISVADVYDAMCCHRPYRPALGVGKAVEELVNGVNKKYDVNIVKILLDSLKKENKISFNFKI